MAQRKTVSISRKPSTTVIPANGKATAVAPSLPPPIAPLKRNGTSDPELDPTIGLLGSAVYGTVYCLSYGVMFNMILLGSCIPGNALIGRAWQDGARAARSWFPGSAISVGNPSTRGIHD
jgi:hypothetical protein